MSEEEDYPIANFKIYQDEINELQSKIETLEAENKQLKGEEPIPYAWWEECPKLAQRTMERIIDENKDLEENRDTYRLANELLIAENKELKEKNKELELSEDEAAFQLGTLKSTLESYQRGIREHSSFIQTMTNSLIKYKKETEQLRVELTKKDKTIESLIREAIKEIKESEEKK